MISNPLIVELCNEMLQDTIHALTMEDISMTPRKLCKQPPQNNWCESTNPGVFLQVCQHTNAGAPGDDGLANAVFEDAVSPCFREKRHGIRHENDHIWAFS